MTADFITPPVDDPFLFGQIAAANALSDVFAMGGRPIMALAVLGMPLGTLPVEMVREILAGGAAICAAVGRSLPVAEYTALQVKQAVVGNGHAKKEQVQEMVRRLLTLPGVPGSDAADALACAICHAHGGMGLGSVATSGYRVRNGRLV